MLTIDDVDLSQWMQFRSIQQPLTSPQEPETIKAPGRPGSFIANTTDESYSVPVNFKVTASSPEHLRKKLRMIAPYLKSKKSQRIVFHDEPDVYNLGIVSGSVQTDKKIEYAWGSMSLLINDPYKYALRSETLQIASDEEPTLTIPTTFAQSYSGTINRAGTAPADLTIHMTMQQDTDQIRLTHEESGHYLELNGDFQAGDTVMIDMATNYVEHNGDNAMTKLSLRSRFFRLQDTNILTFTPEQSADIVATYTPRYY